MPDIRPIRIPGRWREGFVLDYHTISSAFLGYDEYGHPVFDTRRTELGELLFRLKYRSETSALEELAKITAQFLTSWNPGADVIIPVPPSRSTRPLQPVLAIAERLSEQLAIPLGKDYIFKVKDIPELKNIYEYDERLRILSGAYVVEPSLVESKKVLLFDDLYRSGATMNAITAVLYDQGRAADVFALAITRTRSKS
jgi:competence protein ComFC